MKHEIVSINNVEYTFLVDYKDDNVLRDSFNKLTHKVYQFDFEDWYENGCWSMGCIPHSLAFKGEIVSNITANVISFTVLGQEKQFVQLGTVMTDEEYRGRGLSRFLLENVLEEWRAKSDMIYLFANDSVLNFYPKYGFEKTVMYEASKVYEATYNDFLARKIDLNNADDMNLFENYVRRAVVLSKIAMRDNFELVMFYCKYFSRFTLADNIFYIDKLHAIAIAEYDEGVLTIHDVFALRAVSIDDIVNTLALDDTQKIVLKFMPIDTDGYDINLYAEEDSTLFVDKDKKELFVNNKLMFPTLSHT